MRVITKKVIHKTPTPLVKKNTNKLDTGSPGGGIYQSPLVIQINSNYMYKKTTHPINEK